MTPEDRLADSRRRYAPRDSDESWRAVRSLLLTLGALVAVWSGSAVITGLYYVAQGKYLNSVMFVALVLGTALFIGSILIVRRGWQMAQPH
jgi:hypothetical protein